MLALTRRRKNDGYHRKKKHLFGSTVDEVFFVYGTKQRVTAFRCLIDGSGADLGTAGIERRYGDQAHWQLKHGAKAWQDGTDFELMRIEVAFHRLL